MLADIPANERREITMKSGRRIAVIGVALLAVCGSSAASAGAVTPEVDNVTTAVASAGASRMTMSGEPTITCTKSEGSGAAISTTTSEGVLTMFGCTAEFLGIKGNCTSEGQSAGTIAIANTVSHLVYLDENHTKVGALATPPASGLFTKFTCVGFATIEVKGNGVMGEVTFPKCGQTSKEATVVAEATGSTQKYRQIEETGTFYELKAATKGGGLVSAGTNWTVTGSSATSGTLTCPEQK
jgi:hypothetical protein